MLDDDPNKFGIQFGVAITRRVFDVFGFIDIVDLRLPQLEQ